MPRMTIRRWILLVAVVAVGMGTATGLLRRRVSFQRRAILCAQTASQEDTKAMIAGQLPWFASAQLSEEQIRSQEAHIKLADHYRALEAKYRRAARYPWLTAD